MMLTRRLFLLLFLPVVLTGLAAEAGAQVKIDVKGVKISAQKTPKFEFKYATDKNWKPREWMEMEVAFKVETSERDVLYIDDLQFKYYVILKGDPKKQKTLVGTISHVNVPVDEDVASVAYLSPATIARMTGRHGFSDSDVAFWGVEVLYGGQLVGGDSSKGKWWASPSAPAQEEGLILNKKQTPFAPLWGDYHADVAPSGRP